MANIISTLRILIGRPTKQDLWNAYYTAKIKKDYRRMRYYFNEIVKINKSESNFLGLHNNIPEILERLKNGSI